MPTNDQIRERRAQGVCIDCGEVIRLEHLPGLLRPSRCSACRGARGHMTPGEVVRHRERNQRRRHEWRAAGLCSRCGRTRDDEHVDCARCREYRRVKHASARAGRTRVMPHPDRVVADPVPVPPAPVRVVDGVEFEVLWPRPQAHIDGVKGGPIGAPFASRSMLALITGDDYSGMHDLASARSRTASTPAINLVARG